MGCNCTRRARVVDDIAHLRSARRRLDGLVARNETKNTYLSQLGSAVNDTFSPTPLGSTRTEIGNLNREVATAATNLLNQVDERISERVARYEQMLADDQAFHNSSNNNSNR